MNERESLALAHFAAIDESDTQQRTPDGRTLATAHHQTLARWVARLGVDASAALRLAARCQHLGRHRTLRTDFADGVLGYKKWRATAAQRSADLAETILAETGWDATTIQRVRELVTKKNLSKDVEVQLLEDAICLTFIELQLADFAAKHPTEKVDDIVIKTWAKMSPQGKREALALLVDPPENLKEITARLGPILAAKA